MEIGLVHYLTVGAVLFGLGLLTVMTRKNAVGILLGVELILNAAALNFISFEHFVVGDVSGQVFAVFIIVLAASEAATALAIVLMVFSDVRSILADRPTTLRGWRSSKPSAPAKQERERDGEEHGDENRRDEGRRVVLAGKSDVHAVEGSDHQRHRHDDA